MYGGNNDGSWWYNYNQNRVSIWLGVIFGLVTILVCFWCNNLLCIINGVISENVPETSSVFTIYVYFLAYTCAIHFRMCFNVPWNVECLQDKKSDKCIFLFFILSVVTYTPYNFVKIKLFKFLNGTNKIMSVFQNFIDV